MKSAIMAVSSNNSSNSKGGVDYAGNGNDRKRANIKNIEEFSRLQKYMRLADKESAAYKEMKERYIELKVILTIFGVNLTELDYIKE